MAKTGKKTGGDTKAPTKQKPTKAELAKRAKEAEAKKLADAEARLVKKYGNKVVKGSVRRGAKGSDHENKLTVEINTLGADGKPDGKTLRVATSDVHQVNHQPDTARALRQARRNENARAKRAAARAKATK